MLVAALGERHAGRSCVSTLDHEEKDGHAGGAHLSEAAADNRRVETVMADFVQARLPKGRLCVPCAHGCEQTLGAATGGRGTASRMQNRWH